MLLLSVYGRRTTVGLRYSVLLPERHHRLDHSVPQRVHSPVISKLNTNPSWKRSKGIICMLVALQGTSRSLLALIDADISLAWIVALAFIAGFALVSLRKREREVHCLTQPLKGLGDWSERCCQRSEWNDHRQSYWSRNGLTQASLGPLLEPKC